MKEFHKISYQLHQEAFNKTAENESVHDSWFNKNTVDYWRHFRLLEPIKPLLLHFKNASCITVGDGRYGLDSLKLKELQPSLSVLPTDIAPELLVKSKEKGIIEDFAEENAENLSFSDNQFDLSFVVEAYHHFPRPYIGLYEMLRVSKKAIVLVEPQDRYPKPWLGKIADWLKLTIKRLLGKKIVHTDAYFFETTGNYVYSISKREIQKVAIGLQLPTVAFYVANDYYEKGVEFEEQNEGSKLFKKVKRKIKLEDFKAKIGLKNDSILMAVIFKENPSERLRKDMKAEGFELVDLPKNPYL